MKRFCVYLFTLLFVVFVLSDISAARVSVKGYHRKDGTYVRPHYRSDPDGFKWNNYGKASSSQREEWKDLPVLPSYDNDYDNDLTPNRYDTDDDNDLIEDDQDANPYRKSNDSFLNFHEIDIPSIFD